MADIGVYGMAVMGINLALNIASNGFRVAVCNRSPEKVDMAVKRAAEEGNLPIVPTKSPAAFVESLSVPRKIIMMVQAGKAVEDLLDQLIPLLQSGDVLIDAGNELYTNTERRSDRCLQKGILYMGLGVSGGEEGARNGPSMMAGGSVEAYQHVKSILEAIAAKIDLSKKDMDPSNTCVAYLGSGGAGNFVKMVHNGIEYGDMQLIAEAYNILKVVSKKSNGELKSIFSTWNETSPLQSYLIEISTHIFGKKTVDGDYLLDLIVDAAGSKGTGKWTVQQAAEEGVAIPTIAAALDARYISSMKNLRTCAAQQYGNIFDQSQDSQLLLEDVEAALFASKICSYAQGMHLIAVQAKKKGWNISMAEVSRIWKGGCIIRAAFLNTMCQAFTENPQLENLLLDPRIKAIILKSLPSLRRVVTSCIGTCALPCMSASLQYILAVCSERLPTNLTQAQRDFFGAHTFERVDQPGVAYHENNWTS